MKQGQTNYEGCTWWWWWWSVVTVCRENAAKDHKRDENARLCITFWYVGLSPLQRRNSSQKSQEKTATTAAPITVFSVWTGISGERDITRVQTNRPCEVGKRKALIRKTTCRAAGIVRQTHATKREVKRPHRSDKATSVEHRQQSGRHQEKSKISSQWNSAETSAS